MRSAKGPAAIRGGAGLFRPMHLVPQSRLRRDAAVVDSADAGGIWRVAGARSPWRLLRGRRTAGGILGDRRGTTAVLTAMMMTGMIGAAGLAVDSTRLWLVEQKLRTAVDAAALTAARRITDASRDAEATAVFWSHFTQRNGALGYLGATIEGPVITPDPAQASRIRVDATASVPTSLFRFLSDGTMQRTGSATVQRGGQGLELAIVVDQTASMRESASGSSGSSGRGGGSSGSGSGSGGATTKLDAARTAIHAMLDVLYAGSDTQQNLYVSVVPFSRTINIGTGNSAMLDTAGMPAGWNLANWSGCVEARRNGHDTTDAAPTGAARFRPYFWQSTYRRVGTVAAGRCLPGNAYSSGGSSSVSHCHGDNDWPNTFGAPTASQLNDNAMYAYLRNAGMTAAQSAGPNLLCALTPIQPLTASRTAVNAALAAIEAPIKSGGTTTAVGLQGAWYTLSPNWRGHWQDPNSGIPNTPTLPLPYNTPNMRKVVVILTDGDNNWQAPYGASCGSANDSVCSTPTPGQTELNYNAYGRVADYNAAFPSARIEPVTSANADTRLDQRFSAVCEAMKAPGVNITVYVVGFEVASGHQDLLRDCATSRDHYFQSPTAAELQAVFRQVGAQLASIRMVD
ncbi:pilus assembly protein TadG-related protein [Roseomonas sp. AR75]|uniref:pilus assembly protein TadG-related protein n=1 Tax=Roseomonas sp. AR75 TaxID=2562311 RepID=UPI0010C0681C|nr:pilus assembly protein TadG-related protein [Roseomonas sp. AR75]